jgi:hypothetical protein
MALFWIEIVTKSMVLPTKAITPLDLNNQTFEVLSTHVAAFNDSEWTQGRRCPSRTKV